MGAGAHGAHDCASVLPAQPSGALVPRAPGLDRGDQRAIVQGAMDPLSDVCRAVRLNGAFFYVVEAASPWSVSALPARTLIPRLMPGVEHLISYHILTEGSCWGGVDGGEMVELKTGDVVVFPHGDAHLMASEATPRGPIAPEDAAPARHLDTVILGEGAPNTRFVCGFLGCDASPFNPLLAALPPVLHLPRAADGWLRTFPEQVVVESQRGGAGAESMLTRMAELMLIEVVRRYVDGLGENSTGWLAGLRDPLVSAALALLHQHPERDWTIAELATEVATSRSVLAERFTAVIGVPPIQYLAQWRLQLAAERLARGNAKVAAVAAQVGYESEAAFSRAFKRATGQSPAEWRKRRQES